MLFFQHELQGSCSGSCLLKEAFCGKKLLPTAVNGTKKKGGERERENRRKKRKEVKERKEEES